MDTTKPKFSAGALALHVSILIFLAINFAPLLIVLSSSLRAPKNMASPLLLFQEFTFKSYQIAFVKMNFGVAIFNSFVLTAGSVLIVMLISAMAAYPLGRIPNVWSRFLYMFFIAGLIVPGQMVIIPIAQMFFRLGIPSTRFTPMMMFITCSLPFSTFLYTGFIKTIPVEIEEAALIDGAGLFRRFAQIVFPLLKPAIISVIITQGIWIWNDYFYPLIFITKSSQMPLPLAMLGFMGDKENPAQWNVLFAACILCAIPLIFAFSVLQKYFVSGITAGGVKG
jgi:raffinose/stachyose/melibiose transport system permease protein